MNNRLKIVVMERDTLGDDVSLEAFEEWIGSERVYGACGITRINKQRGRPRKKAEEEA